MAQCLKSLPMGRRMFSIVLAMEPWKMMVQIPKLKLAFGSDGNIYGSTDFGGTANEGTLFKLTKTGVETILHEFGDGSVMNDGSDPVAGLVLGNDGNFYGTTYNGG